MLQPRRVKWRRQHRGRRRGIAPTGNSGAFGDLGVRAPCPARQAWAPPGVGGPQTGAPRRAITHYVRRGGKVWIRIFPDKSVTQKPAETRMGKGKGAPDKWVAVVKPGRGPFDVAG